MLMFALCLVSFILGVYAGARLYKREIDLDKEFEQSKIQRLKNRRRVR